MKFFDTKYGLPTMLIFVVIFYYIIDLLVNTVDVRYNLTSFSVKTHRLEFFRQNTP